MSTLRTVYTNIRAARTAIKDMSRLRQIAAVLVRHGLGHVVEAWNLQDRFILKLLVDKQPAEFEPTSIYERIAEAIQDLGPTFIKLGQILSTRPDLIPQAMCNQFARLQDDVAPISGEAARKVVEESLGHEIEVLYDEFDETPLASASIAQVHTARLRSGDDVVVKVQRPGIQETIVSDLSILYFAARQIEATIPEAKAFNPVAIAREFERAILQELDFTHEASHMERFDRNFSSWPTVHIPRCYPEYSTMQVLTMERLRGHKITAAAEAGFDIEAVARECVRMLFKMAFEDGFFHGDLHPGNIFVLDGNRIGLIDFGLTGRMTDAMKDAIADLMMAIVTSNFEGVARSFYEISLRTGHVDYPAFEQDTIDLMERYFLHKTLANVDFGAFLRDLIEGAIRHDVQVPPDYTMFFKAIMTVEGIGKVVAPHLDLVSECRPYVEKLVAQRYSPERVLRSLLDTLQAFARFGRQFPLTANEILRQFEDGRLTLGIEQTQLSEIERRREVRANRAVVAGLAAALLLCGTLMRHDVGFTLIGLPGLSLLAFMTGGGLTARLVWKIVLSRRW